MRESQEFLAFARPDIGEEEIAEVVDSLRSGWLTTGPKTKRFEEQFSKFIGADVQALAVNSATSGLHLALEALGVGPGDEVITTPYTFTATAEVIRYLGADPVFVDIRPDTLNIDCEQIEAAITPRTKAILPVHFAGLAADMDSVLRIARKHGLSVIEDAAHALPSTLNGRLVGSLESDVTVFSFYATKTLATGEGGMVVTRNAKIAARCRTMRLHGIDRDAFDRYSSKTPAWFYQVMAPGFKYNMTDVASSLGIHQLAKARGFQTRRALMAMRYDSEFSGLPLVLPPHAKSGDLHAWHLYPIRLTPKAAVSRNDFIEGLSADGIGTSVHFIPLHIQPYWAARYGLRPSDFPNALAAYECTVSLPIYTLMSDGDQSRVIRAVRRILAGEGSAAAKSEATDLYEASLRR
jgi:dTDP-4-amino-4,6-dideoxygalactose transaminase